MATPDEAELNLDGQPKPSPAAFAKAREERPEVCGSYAPERPYPIYLRGLVERGFGRGGKDLGCPTANLPSKVIQTHPSLNRTGIYYGFARVLPQDPDDPDLMNEQEEAAESSGMPSLRSDSNSSGSREAPTSVEDDVDVQTDDDGDELILSASPINEEAEIDIAGGLAQAGVNSRLSNVVFKPRQLSRSSVRSSRSVKTILEQAGALKLERTTSDASAPAQTSSSEASPLSPSAATTESYTATSTLSSSSPSKPSAVPSTPDKHPRDTSSTSSQTGSVRRVKKRRVPITALDAQVFPMVMSVGWNPFYKNTTKTAEVHILHNFRSDFYGLEMRVVVLGYIRPEYNYVSKEALIDDIEMDKKVAVNSLARSPYQDYVSDPFLSAPS